MSKLIRDIRDHFDGPGKFVLLTIATYADKDGRGWPSKGRLAVNVGQSVRQVNYLVAALVKTGWLTIEQRGDGRGHSTHYRVAKPIKGEVGSTLCDSTKGEVGFTLSDSAHAIKGEVQRMERVKSASQKGAIAIAHELSGTVIEQSLGERSASASAAAHPRQVLKPKQRKRTPGTPWPDGFALSPEMRAFAAEKGVDADVQFELLHNYALNHPNWLHVNWVAAWRTWVVHAKQYAAERAQANSRPAIALVRRLPKPEEIRAQDAAALARRRTES
jgi:hypothetical protein